MQEIAKVSLDNEMDLILAHRRSMKLAELTGLSLSAQTSFATAVSEVARNMIDNGRRTTLALGVDGDRHERFLIAALKTETQGKVQVAEGLEYAKKLITKYNIVTTDNETLIELFFPVSTSLRINIQKLDEWRSHFRNEPPVSPYDEIKRKNELLQELSERIQKSEAQYKTLTSSLPLVIFALDLNGQLLYGNEWLFQFTGNTLEGLNKDSWKSVVHTEDYSSFVGLLNNKAADATTSVKTQARLRHNESGDYLWHQFSVTPFKNDGGELQYWIAYMADIHAQKVFEETLKDNIELKKAQSALEANKKMLESYITELNRSNTELQQFAFVASHDLQEPVRKVLYYSDYLLQNYENLLDKKGYGYLANMQTSAQRMRNLIQDLLVFSQINREQIKFASVDLNKIAQEAMQDLEMAIEEKAAKLSFEQLPVIKGDERMMRQLFENLLSNSIKYSKPDVAPTIEVSCRQDDRFFEIDFRDNGIGFDEKYVPQMFALFQRLHPKNVYEGTGLGLAICKKIAELHNGKISAKAEEGKGATFSVSLPINQPVV